MMQSPVYANVLLTHIISYRKMTNGEDKTHDMLKQKGLCRLRRKVRMRCLQNVKC